VSHEDLLPFSRRPAADIAHNDQQSVHRLLQHYQQMANAATLDEAHLLEGYMAETWQPGTSQIEERRAEHCSRSRADLVTTATKWEPGEV
jgi:enoyl-CoA hydratase